MNGYTESTLKSIARTWMRQNGRSQKCIARHWNVGACSPPDDGPELIQVDPESDFFCDQAASQTSH